jgi:L-asparaginase II
MLALCRANAWPTLGYRLLDHPCQQAMLAEVAAATEVAPEPIEVAIDGCGLPTFAFTLERLAHAFARFPRMNGGDRVAAAMRAHPELVRGPGAADTVLMQELPEWVAKGGAEGLLCATRLDGLGVAVKSADGSTRPLRPALAAFLERLGVASGDLGASPVTNSRGEVVGDARVR